MIELDSSALETFVELLAKQDPDAMRQMMQTMLNACMLAERKRFLGAGPYERSEQRTDHANGFKDRSFKTRVGELDLKLPQVRGQGFYPSCLEKGLRSERAIQIALCEMYLCGVATRKVTKVMEKTCGFEVSSQEVSRAAKEIDEQIGPWRSRALGRVVYLFLDAIYLKVRESGVVRDAACLIAVGVTPDGKRQILGVSLELGEAEVLWRKLLENLVARGLHGIQLVTSDAHAGLKAARRAVFPGVPWQRCQFHLQQNAQSHVPRVSMKAEVASDLRAVFNAPSLVEAQRLMSMAEAKYQKDAPKLAQWIADNVPESLTVFTLPEAHQRRLRTSNMLERLNLEIRRRVKTISSFPNGASALRLVCGVLMEWEEDQGATRPYLTIT